jgi:hypothetical protein
MKILSEIAAQTVEEMSNLKNSLQEKKKNLEIELNEIENRINKASQANNRGASYNIDSGLCPVCFITNGSSFELKPISSDNANDKFFCGHCNLEIENEI